MRVTFFEATNGLPGKVILQQNYSRRIPMTSTAPAALMEGWNRALVEILAEVASDFCSQAIERTTPRRSWRQFVAKMTSTAITTLPTVYLARHGETAWSLSGQHTGLTNVPLTERGERNALRLGRRLAGLSFAKLFSSPLQRAARTCQLAGFGIVAKAARFRHSEHLRSFRYEDRWTRPREHQMNNNRKGM